MVDNFCPVCRKPLTRGFVFSDYPILWDAGEKFTSWKRPDRRLDPPVLFRKSIIRGAVKIRAYHCESCDLFLIHGKDTKAEESTQT